MFRLTPIGGPAAAVATALEPLVLAGLLNEDSPHGLSHRGEELTSTIPTLRLLGIDEPDVGLMHQRRGLQRLPRLFFPQLLGGQLAQLVVDRR